MALRCAFAFVCLTFVAALASAGTPKFVDVPAGDLTDAVELLAKQYEVDVIYPGDLLRGQKTQGLNGEFEAVEAFRKLLDSTPLVLTKEGDALLITQSSRESQPAMARNRADGLPRVLIEARRGIAEAGGPPAPKHEPIFGWARHNAEQQAALARAQALDSKCERLARRGDKKIQVYCTVDANPGQARSVRTSSASETAPGASSCRRLARPGSNRIQSFCGSRALWDEFDMWAVNAGVTCRFAGTSQELCLTVAQWNDFDRRPAVPRVDRSAGSDWPAPPGQPDNTPSLYRPTSPDTVTRPTCGWPC